MEEAHTATGGGPFGPVLRIEKWILEQLPCPTKFIHLIISSPHSIQFLYSHFNHLKRLLHFMAHKYVKLSS